jgi:hypothetical protein
VTRTLLVLILFSLFFGCGGSAEAPKNFPSFDAAASWYSEHAVTDQMTPDSTAIAWAGYCATSDRQMLLVAFTSDPGKRYVFEGVPAEVWAAFKSADSKGKFYHANIKGRYRFGL